MHSSSLSETNEKLNCYAGLAAVGGGPPLEFNANSFLSHAYDGGISVSENLLIFLFATVGLDFCMKLRFISPFPIESSE